VKIGRRTVEVSNRDKVFFPADGLTKGDLVDHYHRAAPHLLRHGRDRLVSMDRYPDGIDGPGFYHKDVPASFPDWITTQEVEKKGGGTLTQLVLADTATLVYLADQACITPHVWTSTVDRRNHPDRMVFDLDPPSDRGDRFAEVRWTARRLRTLLEELDLVPFVMTSGSRGLHVHVPLDRGADHDAVRSFARDVAETLSRRHPARVTTEQRKKKREGRIFVDVLRNAYAQTVVVPYAVRALPGAPVATPLSWDELGRSGMSPRRYGIRNLFRRLGAVDDPWKGMGRHARSLRGARDALDHTAS
jgi:bifunctional non-homologous end joining protein LigD